MSLNGNVLLKTEDLRVDYEVKYGIGDALNTAKLDVYNLAPQTIQAIYTSQQCVVHLEVGNFGEKLSTLFYGNIMNVYQTPNLPERITTLWCWEAGIYEAKKIKPVSHTYVGMSVKNLVSTINGLITKEASSTTLYTINFDKASPSKLNKVVNNWIIRESPLDNLHKLLRQNNLVMSLVHSVIHITDAVVKNSSVEELIKLGNKPFKILPVHLLKPIEFSIATVDLEYILTPELRPMSIIQIPETSEIASSLSGFDDTALKLVEGFTNILPRSHYFLLDVTHRGSAYTNDWTTVLSGVYNDDEVN